MPEPNFYDLCLKHLKLFKQTTGFRFLREHRHTRTTVTSVDHPISLSMVETSLESQTYTSPEKYVNAVLLFLSNEKLSAVHDNALSEKVEQLKELTKNFYKETFEKSWQDVTVRPPFLVNIFRGKSVEDNLDKARLYELLQTLSHDLRSRLVTGLCENFPEVCTSNGQEVQVGFKNVSGEKSATLLDFALEIHANETYWRRFNSYFP